MMKNPLVMNSIPRNENALCTTNNNQIPLIQIKDVAEKIKSG